MGIRLTSFTTPFGGFSWEYTGIKERKKSVPFPVSIDKKLKVFISSKSGTSKYNKVRLKLKKVIEDTQLATVYLFEEEGASSLSADKSNNLAIQDSDVCIFLIDNADGISQDVQKEIDAVNKHGIKALYLFCDEKQKAKTPIEERMTGASFAHTKRVHRFDDLCKEGFRSLVEDIVTIYHCYCKGYQLEKPKINENKEISLGESDVPYNYIPKTSLEQIDKCTEYLEKIILGKSFGRFPGTMQKTCDYDEWGYKFLPVLFEGKSIKGFNTSMFCDSLVQQDETFNHIVKIRWEAIYFYLEDNLQRCQEKLNEALSFSKEKKQPIWVINDILIDLRNVQATINAKNNIIFSQSEAQKEIDSCSEGIHYPILDRISESLAEKCLDGMFQEKIKSPYTVTFGGDIEQCCGMLASTIIVSMYNGSLTQILLIYDRIKSYVFYLSNKYDDWILKLNLFKLAVYSQREKDVQGILNSYPSILNKMSAEEALSVLKFCDNQPIAYQRFRTQLLAFGKVGYLLDDNSFESYLDQMVSEINKWINDDKAIVSTGEYIFIALSGVAYRMSQDLLGNICSEMIGKKHYPKYYRNIFNLVSTNKLDINNMDKSNAQNFIGQITGLFLDEYGHQIISHSKDFLFMLRKQNSNLTEDLDKKVLEFFPNYYNSSYKLETTNNIQEDIPYFIQDYIAKIDSNNKTQGLNGHYSYGERYIHTLYNILKMFDYRCNSDTISDIVSILSDTLIESKEEIIIKLDAISLLILIVLKYPESLNNDKSIWEKIFNNQHVIDENIGDSFMSSNIDRVSLKIGLRLLFSAMNKDVYIDLLELMPLIDGDIATTISVSEIIAEYYDSNPDAKFSKRIEALILQNTLKWLLYENDTVRINATRILLSFSKEKESIGIVKNQILKLIDNDNVYIKTLIIRSLNSIEEIDKRTKDYIIEKCKVDNSYIVRKCCLEVFREK